jgi:hypothetical protein
MIGETWVVVDLERRAVTKWKRSKDCLTAPALRLAGGRMILDKGVDLEVIDADGQRRAIRLPTEETGVLDLTAEGELVIASVRSVFLWRPGQTKVHRWETSLPAGASPTSVATSAGQIAIGYDTGAMVSTSVAEVRARGALIEAPADALPSCTLEPAGPGSFEELGLELVTTAATR